MVLRHLKPAGSLGFRALRSYRAQNLYDHLSPKTQTARRAAPKDPKLSASLWGVWVIFGKGRSKSVLRHGELTTIRAEGIRLGA